MRWAWQPAAAFCLGAVVACGPWLVKNAVVTGNPTYPLLYRVFGGRNWTAAKDRKWEWGHRVPLLVQLGLQRPPPGVQLDPNDPQHGVTLSLLWRNLTDVVARADWQSPLLFGFAPLALLRRRGRAAAACLWLLVGYLFFQWWLLTHRIDRFWLPLLPPAALLAGAGLLWSRDRLWQWFATAAVALVIFYNFSYATTGLCGYNHYTARLDPMRADPTNEFVNYMNRTLARDARVLAVGAADLFHLRRSVVYNTVFDDCIFERIARGRTPGQVAAELRRAGITHIYVSWAEVARYRATYGFSDFVRPRLFRHLCTAQPPVLRRLTAAGPSVDVAGESAPASELYEVIGHEGLRL